MDNSFGIRKLILLIALMGIQYHWANVQIANQTQRDCRVCHGKITRDHSGKPPFNQFGINYFRRQISNNRMAPSYEYNFLNDLYVKIKHNRFLKKTEHLKKFRARIVPSKTQASVFNDYDQTKHDLDPELRIAVRNILRNLTKAYESIRFDDLRLKVDKNAEGQKVVYFEFKFIILHQQTLPDFLDTLQNTPYFILFKDPYIKFQAKQYPYDKSFKHFYQIRQEGTVNYWEFN